MNHFGFNSPPLGAGKFILQKFENQMLTLDEVLSDAASSPGFDGVEKVDVNSRGRDGQTPLHWMATLGDLKGIRLLIRAGAEIDAQDCHGNTSLHEAVSWRHSTAVRLLLEYGANENIRNSAGHSAKDAALSDAFAPTVELFGSNGSNGSGSN